MRLHRWLGCLVSVLLFSPLAAQEPLLLTGARVLNQEGTGYREGVAVLVQDGRIATIGAVESLTVPVETRRIDLAGKTLTPGMIDLHTHLLLHPYDEATWNDQVLKEQLELRTIRGVVAARKTLEAGFTTIRELGTEGAAFADVALRDAVEMDLIPGPTILTATRALVAEASYGPSGFDPRWEVPKGAQVVNGPWEVRRAVRQQIAAGADWIKVYADYRRTGEESTATFTVEELQAAVHEATSAGLPVAAHAATDEAIRRALKAGVKTIEHGYGASAEVLAQMKEQGVALCPTLAAGWAISRQRGWDGSDPEPERVVAARELMGRALESGVTIALGSDAGVFAHGDNALELELLVDYGMAPEAALRAATATAAEVLGRGDDLGRVEEGYVADLVALDGDPLEEISATRRVVLVVQGGRVVAGSQN